MEQISQNKMANQPIKKLIWKLGLPMIFSMVLQALYNVVDSIFVSNMSSGDKANQALTISFPIQILIIAIGVGTGVGLNTILSKCLGEKDNEKVNQIAGNGIFLSLVIYAIFLLFGLLGAKAFISIFTNESIVIDMGTSYLRICCIFSLGSIGYTIYERFLQATGKTLLSTISQISGAITNVILDYIFIFCFSMGVSGAAWATIIGQFISLFVAMFFHYHFNTEISSKIKDIKPNLLIIKEIYNIGLSAIIMQALLSVMMAGMNIILGNTNTDTTILVGSFGIYYKIQQIALFSAFGLSNTIITVLSFNYGMKNKNRSIECIKYGIIDTFIVTSIITILFILIANPLSKLFALTGGSSSSLISVCEKATRIGSLSFVFMGFNIAIQGILQALNYAIKPLIISFLRLVIFVFPIAYIFTFSQNVINLVWWTFLIADLLTCFFSFIFLKNAIKTKIAKLS